MKTNMNFKRQVIRMWNDLGLTVLSNNPLAIEF